MKKLIFSAALVLSLGLAACGDVEDVADENINATDSTEKVEKETEKEETKDEAVETESEIGKMKTIYQKKDLNMAIENGPVKGTLAKVRYATLEPSPEYKSMFNEEEIITLITIEASLENTVDDTTNFYLDQATLVTDTGQQVDAEVFLSDNVGGEFLGKVKKEGNIQWVLKHDESIKKITLHVSGASNSNYDRVGEDAKYEISFE